MFLLVVADVEREGDDVPGDVGLERDADGAFRRVQAQRQDDDGDDVAHVAAEAEKIHAQWTRRRGESIN